MSTFLQLCAKLRQETVDSGTGPAAVTGQSGELKRIVDWIADSYTHLQQARDDWLWLRSKFTVNTVAGTEGYAYGSCTDSNDSALITRFSHWHWGRDKSGVPYFSAYLSSTGVGGEFHLVPLEWDLFRRLYQFGTQNNGQPAHVSVDPYTQEFVLGPKPDAVYVVRGPYQKGPQTLAADGDEPEMPARFHDLIMYDAMSRYAGNRVSPSDALRAASEGRVLRSALERDQLPKISFAGALA